MNKGRDERGEAGAVRLKNIRLNFDLHVSHTASPWQGWGRDVWAFPSIKYMALEMRVRGLC